MKYKELKSLESAELKSKLEELKKELIKLNAQVSTGTAVKNPGQIKQAKKTIARILTIINSQKTTDEAKKPKVVKKKHTEVRKKV